METYLITDSIQIGKLNNAEYTNFMARVLALIDYARAEQFGVTEMTAEMSSLMLNMQDIINRTSASAETVEMLDADAERDACVSYLMATVRAAKNSPVAAQREAYATLEITIRPYKGLAQTRNMKKRLP